MAAPVALVTGTTLQVLGQYGANMSQAEAELENARFYEAQRSLAITAYGANLAKEEMQYQFQRGRITSAIAGGGADVGSGSGLLAIAAQTARHLASVAQIKEQGMLDIQLAGARARRSREMAKTLSSPGYNLLQAGTTVLNAYGSYQNVKQNNPLASVYPNLETPGVYDSPPAGGLSVPRANSSYLSPTAGF